MPTLSLILCTRNDQYMGNARWRLETVLNCTCETLRRIGRTDDVEIIVADWGSEVPLSEVLRLSETARQCTRFLHVPPGVASEKQQDSVFPEVLALNAAFRHSNGRYVGRIDNDTIVAASFFRRFFEMLDRPADFAFDPAKAFLFVHRRCVPFEFASRSPSHRAIRWLTGGFASLLPIERIHLPNQFFQSPVGIMLLHRDVWTDCGGYDETLLYWGWMECDLAFRLMQKYPAIDLGEHLGRSFFHLEHYDPDAPRKVARKCNPCKKPVRFHPNEETWGLADLRLDLTSQQVPVAKTATSETLLHTIRHLVAGLMPLPKLNLKWLSRDWPFSLILYEPKTGHLRRRFQQPKTSVA